MYTHTHTFKTYRIISKYIINRKLRKTLDHCSADVLEDWARASWYSMEVCGELLSGDPWSLLEKCHPMQAIYNHLPRLDPFSLLLLSVEKEEGRCR